MSDANDGATPQTANEQKSVIPAAAPADASSSTNQDFNSRVKSAKGINELRALTEQLRKNPLTPEQVQAAKQLKTQEQAPAPAAEAATAESTAEAASTEESAPAAEAEATETTEAATATETEETEATETDGDSDAGDDSVKVPTAKKLRLRLPDEDQVGRLATSFLQRNRDWTLEQAMDAAKARLGIKPQTQAEAAPKKEVVQESALPQSPEAVNTAIAKLRQDRLKANSELRFEDAAKISDQLEDLIQHRFELERKADRAQIEQAQSYNTTFDKSSARAVELYPQAADAKSDFGKRMIEVERLMEETGDPLFSDPNKPLKIAQMVAAELNIAPRRKGAPAPAAKPAAPVAPAPKKNVVPSGSSRTTAPAANQQPAIIQQAKSVKTIADLRALHAAAGIKGTF